MADEGRSLALLPLVFRLAGTTGVLTDSSSSSIAAALGLRSAKSLMCKCIQNENEKRMKNLYERREALQSFEMIL